MPVGKTYTNLNVLQRRITRWALKCFGAEHVDNKQIRGLRLLEEAVEFAQSVGVPQEKAKELVGYVYSRPVGQPKQELGGVAICLFTAISSIGENAYSTILTEVNRVESKDPAHFAARNQLKSDAGFGLDPLRGSY